MRAGVGEEDEGHGEGMGGGDGSVRNYGLCPEWAARWRCVRWLKGGTVGIWYLGVDLRAVYMLVGELHVECAGSVFTVCLGKAVFVEICFDGWKLVRQFDVTNLMLLMCTYF